jgi:hypothetical protein
MPIHKHKQSLAGMVRTRSLADTVLMHVWYISIMYGAQWQKRSINNMGHVSVTTVSLSVTTA